MKHIKSYLHVLAESEISKSYEQESLDRRLKQAVEMYNVELAKTLIDAGADIHATPYVLNPGHTLLHACANWGFFEMAHLLIDRGAKIDARDEAGMTPLFIAAARGYIETAKLLLEAGADVNSRANSGTDPLIAAINAKERNMARLLIEWGANLENFESSFSHDPHKILDFFDGDIDWMPESDLKRKLKLMKRSKKMFGM